MGWLRESSAGLLENIFNNQFFFEGKATHLSGFDELCGSGLPGVLQGSDLGLDGRLNVLGCVSAMLIQPSLQSSYQAPSRPHVA